MSVLRNFLAAAQAIQAEISKEIGPPDDGAVPKSQQVVLTTITRGTRGYIERVVQQINGCYENGWYDACAVLIRRLIETLIIEAFEAHKISDRIKNNDGDFLYLKELIDKTLQERTWNLGRNAKKALQRLKNVGDKSAHSRRFIAQRGDIQPLLQDIRDVVQELIYLARLKK